MRFTATILLLGIFVTSASFQSTKQKPLSPKPKTASDKNSASAKPKPTPAAVKKTSEKDEWDKANAVTDTSSRIAALKKFVAAFPRSTRTTKAFESISAAEASLGNEKLAAGDPEAAMKLFRTAAKDAPNPLPDQLFTGTLSKLPANLYFRGLREEGIEIAKVLESKAATNVSQLLSIANFYLSVENGFEARRVADGALKVDPNSSSAYQTRGLANRVDFKLEESAADYAKALELEPDSLTARRGLAEMKRSLNKPDEAISLYQEILVKDEANLPARTGLILALFDADKRTEAETELAKSLETNPGNVILLAGAAYWYAAHNEGGQAILYAQKAIDSDPRFVWSHIALARGLLLQNQPSAAERVLLAARKYGNFPTLEYEIASARLAAGLYREASEELAKSFSIKDGLIHAGLGGRVSSEAGTFTELIAAERNASLFTPTAADNNDNASQLKALLQFSQNLNSPEPKSDVAINAADEFIRGEDKMKIHRQIYAASEMLEKKIAIPKVIEITQAAPSNLEAGLDVPEPATAVMASELYENRAIASAGGQYVNVPSVPRATLSAVLRGRIEEINGWANFQQNDAAQAVVHLKRAVGVLPANSAWWRSSTWRLGTALAISGNDAEALEAYIKSYKSAPPDALRYSTIEAVYKRLKGDTIGLEERIGPNPAQPSSVETTAQKAEITPEVQPITQTTEVSSTPEAIVQTFPSVQSTAEASPSATAAVETSPTAADKPKPLEVPTTASTKAEAKPAATSTDLFPPVVITIPGAATPLPKAEPSPQSTPEIKPCSIKIDVESITLKHSEGVLAVIVRLDNDESLEALQALSSSPEDVTVRRESVEGLKTQSLFVVRSISAKTGDYKVTFEMPCGKKEITVKVQ